MKFLTSIALILEVIAAVVAISGKIDVIPNPDYVANGPSRYVRTRTKYGIELPRGGHTRRDNGTLGYIQTSFIPDYYLTPVVIGQGESAQTFMMEFDTGSADLWVFSDLLPSTEAGTSNHTLYMAGKTTTSKQVPGATWNVSYLDGSGAGGIVYTDNLNLGGVSISDATIEATTFVTPEFTDRVIDGIVGLSLQTNNVLPTLEPTIVQQLLNNSELKLPVFTAQLTRAAEIPGFYTFGYINETVGVGIEYTDVLSTVESESPGHWAFESTYALLNGQQINRPTNQAIVDTGTSGILLETAVVEEIYKALGGHFSAVDQGWIFPNNRSLNNYPNLTLPCGTVNITLAEPDDFTLGFSISAPEHFYFGSIQERGNLGFDIYGDFWLRNAYVVFDLGMTGMNKFRVGAVSRSEVLAPER
jgi:Eukaryotic aspartyl protease